MNDYEYTFMEDVKQKKSVAASARHKKNGSKSRYVGLPSDHMSRKEKDALNGPVKTYQMNRPMSYKEFKTLPDDLKEKYLACLIDGYGVTLNMIGNMMGASRNTLYDLVKRKGFTKVKARKRGGRYKLTSQQKQDWEEFLALRDAEETQQVEEPASAAVQGETLEDTELTQPETASQEEIYEPSVIAPSSFSLEFKGKLTIGEIAVAIHRVLGTNELDGTVRISFEGGAG